MRQPIVPSGSFLENSAFSATCHPLSPVLWSGTCPLVILGLNRYISGSDLPIKLLSSMVPFDTCRRQFDLQTRRRSSIG